MSIKFISLDEYVVMPNHIHGIIILVGTGPRACPYNGQPQGVVPTMSLLESNRRMHQNICRLQCPSCLSS